MLRERNDLDLRCDELRIADRAERLLERASEQLKQLENELFSALSADERRLFRLLAERALTDQG